MPEKLTFDRTVFKIVPIEEKVKTGIFGCGNGQQIACNIHGISLAQPTIYHTMPAIEWIDQPFGWANFKIDKNSKSNKFGVQYF